MGERGNGMGHVCRRGLLLAGAALVAGLTIPPSTASAQAGPFLGDHVVGDPNAPILMEEYASLSCPHCAHFHVEIWPRLKAEFVDTGQVRFVFRDFPNNGPGLRAGMLARCGGEARYAALKDILFRTQKGWLTQDFMGNLMRTAQMAGIGPAQFQACMDDKRLEERLLQSQMAAMRTLGLQGTPAFVFNGGKEVVPEANEQKIIDALVRLGAKRKPAAS